MLKLAWSLIQGSVHLSPCKVSVFPLFFITVHLGNKTLGAVHTKRMENYVPFLEGSVSTYICGIILHWKSILFLHILTYAIIHLYQIELRYSFYTLGYNSLPPKKMFLSCCSNFPPLYLSTIGSSFSWLLHCFGIPSWMSLIFFF